LALVSRVCVSGGGGGGGEGGCGLKKKAEWLGVVFGLVGHVGERGKNRLGRPFTGLRATITSGFIRAEVMTALAAILAGAFLFHGCDRGGPMTAGRDRNVGGDSVFPSDFAAPPSRRRLSFTICCWRVRERSR